MMLRSAYHDFLAAMLSEAFFSRRDGGRRLVLLDVVGPRRPVHVRDGVEALAVRAVGDRLAERLVGQAGGARLLFQGGQHVAAGDVPLQRVGVGAQRHLAATGSDRATGDRLVADPGDRVAGGLGRRDGDLADLLSSAPGVVVGLQRRGRLVDAGRLADSLVMISGVPSPLSSSASASW